MFGLQPFITQNVLLKLCQDIQKSKERTQLVNHRQIFTSHDTALGETRMGKENEFSQVLFNQFIVLICPRCEF
ncbi:CLUMA_CG003981, isoform A [Clunio marinus]|uniref:CLUMA_CG003981, isoform A n=1 Tax=Clunio marinus TaxID=568069 RepID=A0A1J1HUU0_9DIPT|nr:CLUMA_CG003981, isoform A [Clunio marinus]